MRLRYIRIFTPACLCFGAIASAEDEKTICAPAYAEWARSGQSMDERAREAFAAAIPAACANLLKKVQAIKPLSTPTASITPVPSRKHPPLTLANTSSKPKPQRRKVRQNSSRTGDSDDTSPLGDSNALSISQSAGDTATLGDLPKTDVIAVSADRESSSFSLSAPIVRLSGFQSWIRKDRRTVYTTANLTPLVQPLLLFLAEGYGTISIQIGSQKCEVPRFNLGGFEYFSGSLTVSFVDRARRTDVGSSAAFGMPAVCPTEPKAGDTVHLKGEFPFYTHGAITRLLIDSDLPPVGNGQDAN